MSVVIKEEIVMADFAIINTKNEGIINDKEIIRDKFYINYIFFYVLGSLGFLPGPFFYLANDYWMLKFRDSNSDHNVRNEYQKTFFVYLSIVFSIPTGLFPVWIYISKKTTINVRFTGCFIVYVVVFILMMSMININTETWIKEFYYLTLVTLFILQASACIILNNLFELVSKFPAKYAGILSGSASLCGIVTTLVQIVSLILGNSSKRCAYIYFTTGLIMITLSIMVYFWVTSYSSFYKHHLRRTVEASKTEPVSIKIGLKIFWKLKVLVILCFVTIYSSMLVHPAITSLILSKSYGHGIKFYDVLFVPIVIHLFQNVSFVVTKFSVLAMKPVTNKLVLSVICLLKIGLIPLMLLCNVQPRKNLPVVFKEDYYIGIFEVLLGISHSFLATSITIAVQMEAAPEERYMANILITFIIAIVSGAFSYVAVLLIQAL